MLDRQLFSQKQQWKPENKQNCYIVHCLRIFTEINPKEYIQAKVVRYEVQQGMKNKESGWYVTRPIPNICNAQLRNEKGGPVCPYPSIEPPSQTTRGLVHV